MVDRYVEQRLRILLAQISEWAREVIPTALRVGPQCAEWPASLIPPIEEVHEIGQLLRSIGLAPAADRLADLVDEGVKLNLKPELTEMERLDPSKSIELREEFGEYPIPSENSHSAGPAIVTLVGVTVQMRKLCDELAAQCGNDRAEPVLQPEPVLSQIIEPTTEAVPGAPTPVSLSPPVRKAYLSYQLAESHAGRRLEDREAHGWLKENGIPSDAGDVGELADYNVPDFETWARYLREARKALGDNKYSKRAGRGGRSVVKSRDIERQRADDN